METGKCMEMGEGKGCCGKRALAPGAGYKREEAVDSLFFSLQT
jgi:hypothetical protein